MRYRSNTAILSRGRLSVLGTISNRSNIGITTTADGRVNTRDTWAYSRPTGRPAMTPYKPRHRGGAPLTIIVGPGPLRSVLKDICLLTPTRERLLIECQKRLQSKTVAQHPHQCERQSCHVIQSSVLISHSICNHTSMQAIRDPHYIISNSGTTVTSAAEVSVSA